MRRTGILIYLSVMERGELDLASDIGIQAAIPDRYWTEIQAKVAAVPRAPTHSNPFWTDSTNWETYSLNIFL